MQLSLWSTLIKTDAQIGQLIMCSVEPHPELFMDMIANLTDQRAWHYQASSNIGHASLRFSNFSHHKVVWITWGHDKDICQSVHHFLSDKWARTFDYFPLLTNIPYSLTHWWTFPCQQGYPWSSRWSCQCYHFLSKETGAHSAIKLRRAMHGMET